MGDLQRDARDAGATPRRQRGSVAALLGLAGVLVICAWGCGGGGRSTAAQSPGPEAADSPGQAAPGPREQTPERDPDAPGEPAGPAASADAVTEADCQALLAHLVSVANAAHVQTVAPEHAPTEQDLAEIRARMAPEFMPMCMSLDRTTLACQMRAQTRDELLACAQ